MKYKCKKCKQEKEIIKATLEYIEGKWETKEAVCKCGEYMESEPVKGMPSLIRTEKNLSKKKRHDKLWKGAKEKLCGKRGINESFK